MRRLYLVANDLRIFNDRLGVFQLYADLLFSHQNVLEPVLSEAQRFVVSGDLSSRAQGTYSFSMEGSQETYRSDVLELGADVRPEFIKAMTVFGYAPENYTIRWWPASKTKMTFDVHFVGDEFIDVDVPDITIKGSFAEPVERDR